MSLIDLKQIDNSLQDEFNKARFETSATQSDSSLKNDLKPSKDEYLFQCEEDRLTEIEVVDDWKVKLQNLK